MALWMVRAGRDGRWEQIFLDNSIIGIGFGIIRDLSKVKSREELEDMYRKAYPEHAEGKMSRGKSDLEVYP